MVPSSMVFSAQNQGRGQIMASLVLFYMRGGFSAVHLKKDVGLFPKYLQKEYFDSAEIVKVGTDDKNDYSSENLKVSDLFFEPRVGEASFQQSKKFEIKCIIKSFLYLLKHPNVTHIMIFNVTRYSVGLAFLIKHFLPRRKIYLKLDANTQIARQLASLPQSFARKLFFRMVSCVDVVSVETKQNYDILRGNPFLAKKLYLVPNGFEKPLENDGIEKENIIITVGTLGLPVKNTPVLLEVLKKLDLKDWKFYFTGPIVAEFKKTVDSFFSENPQLKDKVIFTGAVYDLQKLAELYMRAKVFILPSKYESFGIATIEAASYGDYLILTDTGCARDIIFDERFGFILPNSGTEQQKEEKLVSSISVHLQKIIDGEIDVMKDCVERRKKVFEKFSMENIVKLPVFREWGNMEY